MSLYVSGMPGCVAVLGVSVGGGEGEKRFGFYHCCPLLAAVALIFLLALNAEVVGICL